VSSTIDVILNASSGTDRNGTAYRTIADAFAESRLRPRIAVARTGSEIADLARRAASSNSSLVVAGGGDGTINAIASELVGTDKILGVLPLGTLNHFAKDMGISLDLRTAARAIVDGRVVEIDVGEVNGRIFLNNSSLGLYPSLVHHRQQRERLGYRKWPAFVWAGLTVLRRYPFVAVRLSANGKELHRKTPFVFIGNNEYEMESFDIGTRACLDAGRLCLYVTNETSRVGLVRLGLRALFGKLRGSDDFITICAPEVQVDARKPLVRVSTDGEVTMMNSPLHYRVLPASLRVLVAKSEQSPP
jgi:diacylglycerol kinase family enzyme